MAIKWCFVVYATVVWWSYYYFTNSSATNERDQLASLLAFKGAIHEDPYGALSSWNDSTVGNYCDWKGISCSPDRQHRVIALVLSSQGLKGSLSPHIGNLSFLETIVLSNNSFYGQIPHEIGRLFRLHHLELGNNTFGGVIATSLTNCSNLDYLNLSNNTFVGNIPAELGTLSNLATLGLSRNNLSGNIPPSIGNLSSLSQLSMSECGFLVGEIPEAFSQLRGLISFQLFGNHLFGTVPSGLYNISTITLFRVGGNQLKGSIPSDIGLKLPNLQTLEYGDNSLTGVIPTSLLNASGLQILNLASNYFTGPVPKDLGRLLHLQRLLLSFNRFQDDFSFISSLTNCSSLTTLYLDGNLLRGSLPNSVANLSSNYFSYLTMDSNEAHGCIPAGIESLLNLNLLSIKMNHLTSPIPSGIGKLSKLQELHLTGNKFTEALPSSFGNLTLLNKLLLGQNNMYGTIPPSLTNCTNLVELDLSHNNLNGSIPPELTSMSSFSISFNLAHNTLTGSLPSQVGSLKNLVELDVSHNRLSGVVPNSLVTCVMLVWLRLDSNLFEGDIPQGLAVIRGLQELDLSNNNLSGQIPSFLGEFRFLGKLNLSFNRLQGPIPKQGVFLNASAFSVIGNTALCGGIKDLKLPPCPASNSKRNKFLKVTISLVIVGVMCAIVFVSLFICFHRRGRLVTKGFSIQSIERLVTKGFSIQSIESWVFTYAELHQATDGFSTANQIGVGNHGSIYWGIVKREYLTEVAVKVLSLDLKGASRSFMSECQALRMVRHRNIVKILGTCSSVGDFQGNEFKALVYEYMSNGSLEKWLHPDGEQEGFKFLTVIERLDIAIHIASALQYLHNCGSESMIVHGDLKPSNILLDDDMTARVGDFGLAKVISTVSGEYAQDESNCVGINGTIGYVAPEYGMGSMVSPHGDVYSFGILLLEIFTGKRPTDDAFNYDLCLHDYVRNSLPDRVTEVVDPSILLEHDRTSRTIHYCMVSLLKVGVECSMKSPRDRMEMGEAITEICNVKDVYVRIESE